MENKKQFQPGDTVFFFEVRTTRSFQMDAPFNLASERGWQRGFVYKGVIVRVNPVHTSRIQELYQISPETGKEIPNLALAPRRNFGVPLENCFETFPELDSEMKKQERSWNEFFPFTDEDLLKLSSDSATRLWEKAFQFYNKVEDHQKLSHLFHADHPKVLTYLLQIRFYLFNSNT